MSTPDLGDDHPRDCLTDHGHRRQPVGGLAKRTQYLVGPPLQLLHGGAQRVDLRQVQLQQEAMLVRHPAVHRGEDVRATGLQAPGGAMIRASSGRTPATGRHTGGGPVCWCRRMRRTVSRRGDLRRSAAATARSTAAGERGHPIWYGVEQLMERLKPRSALRTNAPPPTLAGEARKAMRGRACAYRTETVQGLKRGA